MAGGYDGEIRINTRINTNELNTGINSIVSSIGKIAKTLGLAISATAFIRFGKEAIELAEYIRDLGYMPEQVQDFIPTPGSASTAMYYSGINPETGKKVFVARNPHDKAMQRALMQYKNPKNRQLVKEALQQTNRGDLMGDDAKCLLKISPSHNPKARHSKIAFNPKINKRR